MSAAGQDLFGSFFVGAALEIPRFAVQKLLHCWRDKDKKMSRFQDYIQHPTNDYSGIK